MPELLNTLRSIDDSGELSSLLPPALQDPRISKENANASATFLRILQARVVFDGCLGFRATTNLHRREEGHLFEWRALQTMLAAVQLSVGAKFELSFCVYRAWRDTYIASREVLN